MKKKLAVILAAVMTMSMSVPAFAHQVIVVDPSKEAVAETKEAAEEEKTAAEETATEEEKTTTEETVAEEEKTDDATEAVVEEVKEEEKKANEPIVTSPNKEKDRSVVKEEGTSTTYSKVKEPKTIYNTAPSADHPFIDVTGANEDYVKAAYGLGMTWGMTKDAIFSPDTTLTMEDAITWLYRLEGAEGKNGIIIAKMSEANGYAQKPLTWAAGLGLVDGSVEPKSEITVAQLNSMIDKLGFKTNIVGTENTMTRMDGLKTILDSLVGTVNKVNQAVSSKTDIPTLG